MEKGNPLYKITAYEVMIFIFLSIALLFLILTGNIYIGSGEREAGQLFFVSLILLVMGLLGWLSYNQLGEKIRYETIDQKYIIPAVAIVLGSWILGYSLFQLGIYEAGLGSTITPSNLLKYLGMLSSIFLILFAFIENLIFVVVIPLFILESILGVSLEEAKIKHYLFAAIISGLVAALAHVAWKPVPALVNTFIYFSSWTFSTLLLRNSILADIVHMVGNALGILYVVMYPGYILW
ncbi:MAG: hypothetical protein QW607_00860 [Desulfurococcaceae archaeon]